MQVCFNSCMQQNNLNSAGIPKGVISLQKNMFPGLKKVQWNVEELYYVAELNTITRIPDTLAFQNGYVKVAFFRNAGRDGEWFLTYRHIYEPKDVARAVPEKTLNKIKTKLAELGGKEIGNIGISDCATECTLPPNAKYRVFGLNYNTMDSNMYYFSSEGELIR